MSSTARSWSAVSSNSKAASNSRDSVLSAPKAVRPRVSEHRHLPEIVRSEHDGDPDRRARERRCEQVRLERAARASVELVEEVRRESDEQRA